MTREALQAVRPGEGSSVQRVLQGLIARVQGSPQGLQLHCWGTTSRKRLMSSERKLSGMVQQQRNLLVAWLLAKGCCRFLTSSLPFGGTPQKRAPVQARR